MLRHRLLVWQVVRFSDPVEVCRWVPALVVTVSKLLLNRYLVGVRPSLISCDDEPASRDPSSHLLYLLLVLEVVSPLVVESPLVEHSLFIKQSLGERMVFLLYPLSFLLPRDHI